MLTEINISNEFICGEEVFDLLDGRFFECGEVLWCWGVVCVGVCTTFIFLLGFVLSLVGLFFIFRRFVVAVMVLVLTSSSTVALLRVSCLVARGGIMTLFGLRLIPLRFVIVGGGIFLVQLLCCMVRRIVDDGGLLV